MRTSSFGKKEKLKSRKALALLFKEGRSLNNPPLRMLWIRAEQIGPPSVKIAVAVPKRNFRKAVDRNTLKRRMREAYRRNKNLLHPQESDASSGLNILFLYTGKDLASYRELEEKIRELLSRLFKVTSEKS